MPNPSEETGLPVSLPYNLYSGLRSGLYNKDINTRLGAR